MPVNTAYCRSLFKKLDREKNGVKKNPTPDNVHKFRTRLRRVETVLDQLVGDCDRNGRKLGKLLKRFRKKAGKVRDLDVQTVLLRNLRIAREAGQKPQLLRKMVAERNKKSANLADALDHNKKGADDLHKRLKRLSSSIELRQDVEPLDLAIIEVKKLSQDGSPLTENNLHNYRIVTKQARYLAEAAVQTAETKAAIEKFGKVQDVVGEWHDWLTLTERAEKTFGGVKDSALVAAMRNLTRAKFREAVNAVTQLRKEFGAKPPAKTDSKAPPKKSASVPFQNSLAA